MANVSFKRGLAANLAAAGFSAQDGVFYLTTDTHRLYVGQGSELVDLNRYIKYVSVQSDLDTKAAVGDFAFVEEGSLLCVYNGTGWVQINAQDGNDVSRVSSITTPTVTSSEDGITVSFSVNQTLTDKSGNTKADGSAIPVSFKIAASDLTTANKVAVGLAASANATSGIDLATSGSGATGNKINVKGGNNVTVGMSNGAVEIAAKDTTYTVKGTDNTIVLTDSNGDNQGAITVVSGSKITASVTDNKLTIAHAGLAAAQKKTGTAIQLSEKSSFDVITEVTAADGHITDYTVSTVTVPDYADTQYKLAVAASDANTLIQLNEDSGTTAATVVLKPSTDMAITPDAEGNAVTVAHKTYAAVTPTANTSANIEAVYGKAFTVLDGITTNNGHVTGITTKQVTMPSQLDDGINAVKVSANNAGNISVTVSDNTGAERTGTATGAVYMTVNGNKVYNQGNIDFYTKSEIDSKINGIDAMRYKGTVGGTGATVTTLPTASVAIGDTYMVAVAGTYGGHSCDVGDLLIATGTETNGVITTGLAWTYVPSGDDTDSQFSIRAESNQIILRNDTAVEDTKVAVTIGAGKDISVSTSGNTINVAHDEITTTGSEATGIAPKHGESFTVLDTITADNGHVTAYTTKKVTLPTVTNTQGVLDLVEGHKIHYSDKTGQVSDVILANDGYITLTDNLNTDTITIGHKSYSTPLTATANTTPNQLQPQGTFTAVTGVSRDAGGHVTGFNTQVFTLPEDKNTEYSIATNDNNQIILSNTEGDEGDYVQFKAGTATTVTSSSTGITIGHANVTNSHTAATAESPSAGNTFTVVKDVTVNAQGHTTAVKTVDIKLPEDKNTEYKLSGSVSKSSGNGAQFNAKLATTAGDGAGNVTFNIESSTLQITAANNTATVDLVWGSF